MSLFEKEYEVAGRYGIVYKMTAKQLCDRIKEDSKSDYNWIAPARVLVRICKLPDFPVEYSLIIKVAILNCFANIEHRANCGGDRYRLNIYDEKAVEYCYNSMYGIDSDEACSARKKFLLEKLATASHMGILDLHYHPGPTYKKLREDWSKSKFEEYISEKEIDFKKMVETLEKDFIEVVKKAEANGDFEEDEKKDAEKRKPLFTMIKDI